MTGLAVRLVAGPLALARAWPATTVFLVFLALLLTVVTQIGGIVLWLCIPAFRYANCWIGADKPAFRAVLFLGIFSLGYFLASVAAIPLAALGGRVPLDCGLIGEGSPGPRTAVTCLLNRHYVAVPVRQALREVNSEFASEANGAEIAYLDAAFPFFDWFPMLPHISHGNGRKVDLALFFEGRTGSPSPIGYWGFVQPRPGDPRPCRRHAGFLRWDVSWLQPFLPKARLDPDRSRRLLIRLAEDPKVRRILIEPHLRARLGLTHPKIRFQGCWAARHDDHMHIEFR